MGPGRLVGRGGAARPARILRRLRFSEPFVLLKCGAGAPKDAEDAPFLL